MDANDIFVQLRDQIEQGFRAAAANCQANREKPISWNRVLENLKTNNISFESLNEIDLIGVVQDSVRSMSSKWLQNFNNSGLRVLDKDNYEKLSLSSAELCKKSNSAFKSGRKSYSSAILLSTLALKTAPAGCLSLLSAHITRSEPLFGLGRYEECFMDIQFVKDNSDNFKAYNKVLYKQAQCAIELKNREYLEQVIFELEEYNASQSNKACDVKQINELKKSLSKLPVKPISNLIPSKEITGMQIIENKYVEFDDGNLFSDVKKCHMIAGQSIKENGIIKIEKPFAFVPYYNYCEHDNLLNCLEVSCNNCAQVNVIAFLCNKCKNSTYCSRNCRDEHYRVHKFECIGFKTDIWYQLNDYYFLGFHTFLCGFESLMQMICNAKLQSGLNAEQLFKKVLEISANNDCHDYCRILMLPLTFKRNNKSNITQLSATSVMLTVYLKNYTNFFEKLPKELYSVMPSTCEWDLFVSALILRHIAQAQQHRVPIIDLSFNVNHLDTVYGNTTSSQGKLHQYFKKSISFQALYPSMGMFKQSCDPNTTALFNKSSMTIYATKDIAEGSEIFYSYCPTYKMESSKLNRMVILKGRNTEKCDCEVCLRQENQPIDDDTANGTNNKDGINLDFDHYVCGNCREKIFMDCKDKTWFIDGDEDAEYLKIICKNCNKTVKFTWFYSLMRLIEVKTNYSHQDFNTALSLYIEGCENLSKYHILKEFVVETLLAKTILIAGNRNQFLQQKLLNLILEYMDMKKFRYGELSLDYMLACTYLLDLMSYRLILKIPQVPNGLKMLKITWLGLSDQAKSHIKMYISRYISATENFL